MLIINDRNTKIIIIWSLNLEKTPTENLALMRKEHAKEKAFDKDIIISRIALAC